MVADKGIPHFGNDKASQRGTLIQRQKGALGPHQDCLSDVFVAHRHCHLFRKFDQHSQCSDGAAAGARTHDSSREYYQNSLHMNSLPDTSTSNQQVIW